MQQPSGYDPALYPPPPLGNEGDSSGFEQLAALDGQYSELLHDVRSFLALHLTHLLTLSLPYLQRFVREQVRSAIGPCQGLETLILPVRAGDLGEDY